MELWRSSLWDLFALLLLLALLASRPTRFLFHVNFPLHGVAPVARSHTVIAMRDQGSAPAMGGAPAPAAPAQAASASAMQAAPAAPTIAAAPTPAPQAVTAAPTAAAPTAAGGIDAWPLDGCPPPEATGCTVPSGGRAVAVLLEGHKAGLLLNSTLQHAVRPAVADGCAVHVYISLSMWGGERMDSVTDPSIARLGREALRRLLNDWVREVGACLACADLPADDSLEKEKLALTPDNPGQIMQYPPYSHPAGRAMLGEWMRFEHLWEAALKYEMNLGTGYLLFMRLKHDSLWTDDILAPSQFLDTPDAGSTLFAKFCQGFGGVNPHAMVFGRQAAETMMTLFSGFMQGGIPVPTGNAQQYILQVAQRSRMPISHRQPQDLPECMARRKPEGICVEKTHWCGPGEPPVPYC